MTSDQCSVSKNKPRF